MAHTSAQLANASLFLSSSTGVSSAMKIWKSPAESRSSQAILRLCHGVSFSTSQRVEFVRVSAIADSDDATSANRGEPIDEEEVQDQVDVADILKTLEVLRVKRDMVFNEVRLSIMIEDPREAARKKELGIDDPSGCTREELAEALVEVKEGNVPKDRMALRALADDMRNWPLFEEDPANKPAQKRVSMYARLTDTGVSPQVAAQRASVDADWDSAVEETAVEEKSLGEVLPPWVGYGFLYGVSFIPIIIGVVVVIILFLNSLQ